MNPLQALILMDRLGILDESRKRALEEARENDPVVRHAFRELDPNAPEIPEPLAVLAEKIAVQIAFMRSPMFRFREVMQRAGLDPTPIVPPVKAPYFGRQNGLLLILYERDTLPDGKVVITIKSISDGIETEIWRKPLQLKRLVMEGKEYWHGEVPIRTIIGKVQPGTQLDYCVDPTKSET